MKTEDQIKALAELDGLHSAHSIMFRGELYIGGVVAKPYLTSYDAIIPLVQKQSWNIQTNTANALSPVCSRTLLNATPSQLCEALLVATGKWIENEN